MDGDTGESSRFARLYRRDSSASLLRVKMARRRSQSQKENRERAFSRNRGLEPGLGPLSEKELSLLDGSEGLAQAPLQPQQGKGASSSSSSSSSSAVEERKKMLERYREAKLLQKEKERREKERKGVFKVGLYKPDPAGYLSRASAQPAARSKAPAAPAAPTRVTRSMRQQQDAGQAQSRQAAGANPPQTRGDPSTSATVPRKEQAAVSSRGPQTRAASRAQAAPPAGRARAAPEPAGSSSRAPQTRAASRMQTAPPAGRARGAPGKERPKEAEEEKKPGELPGGKRQGRSQDPPSLGSAEGETDSGAPAGTPPSSATDAATGQAESVKTPPPSFAPQDFVFQPPQGLGTFSLNPMTPRSADAFLTPTYHWSPRIHPASNGLTPMLLTAPASPSPAIPSAAPAGEQLTAPSGATACAPEPLDPLVQPAPQHDVPYFRAAMRSEADRLAELCEQWGGRTEDPGVPEEMQDLIRTTVGQAHLLMAERFQQFVGLVDDCEFGRGEKETTCTDLEGFWDMVYFQVEDVSKKFSTLTELEQNSWQQVQKPKPRAKKMARKPAAAAPSNPQGPPGAAAAAKSRLAAAKAAMRARKNAPAGGAQPDAAPPDAPTVVFDAGFFRVESPAKLHGSARKSSRHGAAAESSPAATPSRRSLFRTPAAPPSASPAPSADAGEPAGPPRPLPEEQPASLEAAAAAAAAVGGQEASPAPAPSLCPGPADVQDPQRPDVPEPCLPPGLGRAPALPLPASGGAGALARRGGALPADANDLSFTLSPAPAPPGLGEPSCRGAPVAVDRPGPPSPPCLLAAPPPAGEAPAASPAPLLLGDRTDSLRDPASALLPDSPSSLQCEALSGLDFERYLQPTARCSMSPRETVAMEVSSPALLLPMDVEMDSPVPSQLVGERESEEQTDAQTEDTCTAPGLLAAVPALLHSVTPVSSPRSSDPLCFTPMYRETVRQSLVARDLMTFTPPTSN